MREQEASLTELLTLISFIATSYLAYPVMFLVYNFILIYFLIKYYFSDLEKPNALKY